VDEVIPLVDFVGKKTNVLWKWIKAIYQIRKNIKKERPDIVIGIMGLCTLISYIASMGLRTPVVMTEHNAFERPASAPFPFSVRIFKFWINKIYNHITVLTEADKNVIGNRFKNVTVMPNPLCVKPVDKVPPKEKTVLAVGRINGWNVKGFDILIKSWKRIQDLNDNVNNDDNLRDWWLKIAGDGKKESFKYLMNLLPDGEWVFNDNVNDNDNKSAVWRSEKYRIEFLGFRKDIEEMYKKSSIFVLSSRYEGFGLVLIEAMSQGCAPVACDYKGRQREILNPSSALPEGEGEPNRKIEITENGILCEPDDVEALASALKKMMEDEKYREQAQRMAVERSHYYTLENIITKWENLLNKIVS
jgi:glycosyltransferase involved in cell wall biosynthesis